MTPNTHTPDKINQAKDAVAKKYTIPTNSEFELEIGIKEIQCSNWGQLIRHAIRLYYEKHEEEPLNKIINESISLYHQSAIEEAGRELPDASHYPPFLSIKEEEIAIDSADWMRTEASKVIAKKDAEIERFDEYCDMLIRHRDELQSELSTLTTSRDEWKRLSEEKIVELNELRTTKQSAGFGLEEILKWVDENKDTINGHPNQVVSVPLLKSFIQSLPHQSTKHLSLERELLKWIDEMIEAEERGGDLSYKGHRIVYAQVRDKLLSIITTEHTEAKATKGCSVCGKPSIQKLLLKEKTKKPMYETDGLDIYNFRCKEHEVSKNELQHPDSLFQS